MTISLVLSWTCSAIRSALNAVERTQLEGEAQGGNRRASIALKLVENPPRSAAPLDFLTSLAIVSMAIATAWRAFEQGVPSLGAVWDVLVVLFIWGLGAILSALLGVARAQAVTEIAAPTVNVLLSAARPLFAVNSGLVNLARGQRGGDRQSERMTGDDIRIIVAEGKEERKLDEIDPQEREMIAGIIEMGERSARDIMIPRPDVIGIEAGSNLESALDVAAKYGHSRLPVFEEDLDHIIGILHVKDLIQRLRDPGRETTLRALVRPVHYVPDTAKADTLLRDLLKNRVHMAAVVDEYGGTAGVLTIEDALEEIVGEIRDEYDAAEEPDYVRVSESEALFKAKVPVSEVNDLLSIHLPTEESDTLGGLVYSHLGKMPKPGDHLVVDGIKLTVTAVFGRRIKQVRVKNPGPVEEGETVRNGAS